MNELFFCNLEDLKKNKIITRLLPEVKDEITAVLKDEEIKIFSSFCPHFGGDFKFDYENMRAVCQWHDWVFDIKTSKCETHKINCSLKSYQFKILDNKSINIIYQE